MATCPRGHESATADYCDVCGSVIRGAAADPPAGPGTRLEMLLEPVPVSPHGPGSPGVPPPGTSVEMVPPGSQGFAGPGAGEREPEAADPCPVCGAPRTGRFCEEDGYDFLLAPPVEASAVPTGPPPHGVRPEVAGVGEEGQGVVPGPSGPAADNVWQVEVAADRTYFDIIMALGGEDAGALRFPLFLPKRRFELDRDQLLIGRRSRSRGVHPDIDLTGPPEDPGVSHLHALLLRQPGGWAVVDLDSANGTYLNSPSAAPIAPNTPMSLADGDRIYLGAWTSLTIHSNG